MGMLAICGLLDLVFLIDHVLSDHRIKFLNLHLFRHGSLVFAGGVVMACTSRRNQFDFLSHINTLDLLTFRANVADDLVDTNLVNNSHALGRYSQLHESILTLKPESVVVNIR